MRRHTEIATAWVGLAMGFGLERMGFADYGEVHRMFTFASFRLFLTFLGAVAFTMAGFALVRRTVRMPRPVPLHRGVVVGSLLFGLGWALTGACPSIAVVQLGEGRLPALATTLGILLGNVLYRPLQQRFMPPGVGSSCGD